MFSFERRCFNSLFSDEYTIYEDTDDNDNNLVLSYECTDLCESIADVFESEYKWLDILEYNDLNITNLKNELIKSYNINEIKINIIFTSLLVFSLVKYTNVQVINIIMYIGTPIAPPSCLVSSPSLFVSSTPVISKILPFVPRTIKNRTTKIVVNILIARCFLLIFEKFDNNIKIE